MISAHIVDNGFLVLMSMALERSKITLNKNENGTVPNTHLIYFS